MDHIVNLSHIIRFFFVVLINKCLYGQVNYSIMCDMLEMPWITPQRTERLSSASVHGEKNKHFIRGQAVLTPDL